VLRDEPHLQFVSPNHVAHEYVIRPIVPSIGANLKITHPSDLAIAEALIMARSRQDRAPSSTAERLIEASS
jgi:hypothetical protein